VQDLLKELGIDIRTCRATHELGIPEGSPLRQICFRDRNILPKIRGLIPRSRAVAGDPEQRAYEFRGTRRIMSRALPKEPANGATLSSRP